MWELKQSFRSCAPKEVNYAKAPMTEDLLHEFNKFWTITVL